ncbi:hypothetical protein E2C01_082395 [Portunus trituberculatus]|uniref:Uncharacterized protein n=1 Tax=Portunus trituberculatus TaxID=210409 RepID=A0A5B7IS84_PORTR|nr:hypothetical protein [Portunus trituberculatus]
MQHQIQLFKFSVPLRDSSTPGQRKTSRKLPILHSFAACLELHEASVRPFLPPTKHSKLDK